jgi:hypothetical protein
MAVDAVLPHVNGLERRIPVAPATPKRHAMVTPFINIARQLYFFIAIYQYSYADLMPLYERAETILFALLMESLMLFVEVIIFTDVEIGP